MFVVGREIADVEEEMSSMTERWLLVEELLKQRNAQQQEANQQQLVQDGENSIDTVHNNPVPLSLQDEKNDQTLKKLRVSHDFILNYFYRFPAIQKLVSRLN